MTRGIRLKILLGACIVGIIGVIVDSNLLISGAVGLLLLSCLRNRETVPTNYTEKFGPPDAGDSTEEEIVTPFTGKIEEGDDEPGV